VPATTLPASVSTTAASIAYPTTPYITSYGPIGSSGQAAPRSVYDSPSSFQATANQPMGIPPGAAAGAGEPWRPGLSAADGAVPKTAQGPNYEHAGPSLR
jgi:hypothetical protein